MNCVQNRSMHPHLRDEEAVVVENAIRLAIDSIVNVLYGVNGGRAREYQRMVADRDKEIRRLERRLREIEHELQLLRRQGCTCGLLEAELGPVGGRGSGEQSGFEPGTVDPEPETTVGQHEGEMSISVGLFARPPSQVSSSHSHESAPPSSPSRPGLDQTGTSHSSDASGGSDRTGNLPTSPSSSSGGVVVKEEPCDTEAVFIKWEMSEERFKEHEESRSSPHPDLHGPRGQDKLENRGRQMFMDRPESDPCEHSVMEGDQMRRKRSVPMSELPEEAQRLKRAAWRAASRRYYARKVARQQGNPPRPGAFPPVTHSQLSAPMSLANKRRRTLISELPAETQSLQREAWRAASRRYYARKIGRQTEPPQFSHFLQDMDPTGQRQPPEARGGRLGGILCS
ncbi:uncharacterized protein LOC115435409 isoform X2 [Sphaeramia orbicularis]|uniref:uncharacterized protein LOC115435409 isoform X2 n=1 Tax=Sphaeramia orbicularis TaxID=375764 RepID=UPI00117F8BBC|nr:uncharacterized protein LOC115435409 isoform X2 [Sphaeramia orbicularis]